MHSLLQFALKEAVRYGASDAEAYVVSNSESEVFMENNDLKQAKSQVSGSLGIRVFINGGSLGFYSINQLNRSKISEAASMAVKIAKISPSDKRNSLPSSKKKIRKLQGIFDRESSTFEASDAAKHALELLKAAKSFDERISVDSGNFGSSVLAHSIANTNGIYASERISTFYWSIMGMAVDGSEVSNFDVQSGGSHTVKGIDVTQAAEDFAKTVIMSLGSRKIESFKGSMLLSPSAAIEIIADVISYSVNSESVQRRASAFGGKLGKKVASEILTVEDDATNTTGLGASSFDREGLEHRQNKVIQDGNLTKFLYNTYTAKKDGVKSTANAGGSSTSPPSVSATNIVVKPGSHSLDELISEVRRGVLINRFSGNVNPITGDFSGVVKGGRQIQDGSLGPSIKEVMVAGNVFDCLRRLVGLSKERKVLFNMILPFMQIEGMSFTAG